MTVDEEGNAYGNRVLSERVEGALLAAVRKTMRDMLAGRES
jgi:hypothetical protein